MALILVVDDQELVCESIKASLESRGHTVHTAQAVSKGIQSLHRCITRTDWPFSEAYAAAVIDLRFVKGYDGPDYDIAGMHVVKEALKVPFLEAIVLTAFPSIDTAAESLEKGVFRYIVKSEHGAGPGVFMGRLAQAVELALENREVMRTLDESLRELRNAFETMQARGTRGVNLSEAKNYLSFAQKAYEIILRARGRFTTGESATSNSSGS